MDADLFAYLEDFLTPRRRELFKDILARRTKHITVVTEGVYQLHNTSAVVRSCDIFGIQELHVIEEIEGRRIDKEIAMGAQKWVDVIRYDSVESCIATLRDQGYKIIATTPHGEAVGPKKLNITQKIALFFGKEGDGLSDYVMQHADAHLTIPMYGFTESLNISVAAAISLYELSGRLRSEGINWELTADEIKQKRIDWTLKSIKNADQIIDRFLEDRNNG
ncbi:RNA methyltransferase [Gilvibacter sediminis]|nr:RNA methyltransferase [Gilvibacter sediminis]MDC7999068.1 RNA methyltransferase [Gilvibacter sediminis]